MEETWESRFINTAKAQGHSDAFITECLGYAHKLMSHNVPVIFDVHHFSILLGIEVKQIYAIIININDNYKKYSIRKKSGGKRDICAPKPILKQIQRWIYKNILLHEKRISNCAHGFIPKDGDMTKGIISNAKPHVGKKVVVSMDLKDFFTSIYKKKVFDYFLELGYDKEIVDCLTSLCCLNRSCPQGAPTSPTLSNIIFRPVDEKISNYCNNNHLTYSRYADDITVSGDDINAIVIIEDITKILRDNGYRINRKKTRIRIRGTKQEVTGLTISDGIHVPKSYRQEVWRELHFCKKYGVVEHIKHLNNRNECDRGYYKSWLLGRIQFIRQVDKITGDKMLTAFNKLAWAI